jgi:Protein of unknown function (DUF1376)
MSEPLVPAEVDLRGMTFMPLFGDRLFKSAEWIEACPAARAAALQLLWHAYAHEVPAASLPDHERVLADHAGLSLKSFRHLREQALRGWVKCSDGRLYHPVLAEIAIDSWNTRLAHRARSLKWREKQRGVTVTSPSRDARQEQEQGQGQEQEQGQDIDRAFALWQEAAAREGWPEVMFLNSVRRFKLGQRLSQCGGLNGWCDALAAASGAGFLKAPDGRFHRWFDLDWLLDEQKFTRLLEGRYAERRGSIRLADGGGGLDAALAELGRAGAQPGRG